jgi:hypothetical protein
MNPLKEVTRIKDRVFVSGGVRTHDRGGLVSADGKPVAPELIARAFQVSIEEATEISRRMSL